jgi:transcriptional regulator with XRE-family HTH domain
MATNSKKFGSAVRRIREYHDLSQTALAKKLGRSANFICQVEGGTKGFSIETLDQIAALFGLPSSALVAVSEDEPKTAIPAVRDTFHKIEKLAWDLIESSLPKLDRRL